MTGLDGAAGTVEYRTEAADADGAEVQVVLRDADGVEVATGSGASGTLRVPDVHRWAPGDGYLYDLEVRLVDGTGTLLDSYHQSVGVRTVEVRGTQFLVNGEPVHFTGFGMHEDHADARQGAQRRPDAARLRAAGVDRRELVPDLALPLLARTCWTTPTAAASWSSTRPPRSG